MAPFWTARDNSKKMRISFIELLKVTPFELLTKHGKLFVLQSQMIWRLMSNNLTLNDKLLSSPACHRFRMKKIDPRGLGKLT